MARIRLSIIRRPHRLIDRQGQEVTCEGIRLKCPIVVGHGTSGIFHDAFVDSCSEFSLFPDRAWKEFDSEIEWLSDRIVTLSVRVTAGEYPFRLGRIRVTPFQADLKQQLAPITILGQFTEDDGKLNKVLLGLAEGILQHHRLIVEPGLHEAWLEQAMAPSTSA